MRPVHRQRKFNPKKFTYGQFYANPYRYTRIKTGKRPYRVHQGPYTSEVMIPPRPRPKKRKRFRGTVGHISEQKYRHIVDAAKSNLLARGRDPYRLHANDNYLSLLKATGYVGGRPLPSRQQLARSPFMRPAPHASYFNFWRYNEPEPDNWDGLFLPENSD